MADNKEKIFKEDLEYRNYRIKHFGKKYGWELLSDVYGYITFINKEAVLYIDAPKLIIETELTHPKQGETRLRRQGDFTMKIIEQIFRNPRVHTPAKIKTEHVLK